ncbi:hypothetical protein SPBR_01093 [Sporothrix brasiliensis 5110]|uniref:Uncharacterized protein n=1 Tax=Sporothrix brasiliensis 5110 TaxID=1398154 RepID=A0A0C2IY16_9PEZI|nr:uncharacterized protein SPBR_01093 [Sporothrix brasiliensis 5110]KIH89922.1 hypothetical protein SPBR_01093 [Sporothrix brasiliensis 5110]
MKFAAALLALVAVAFAMPAPTDESTAAVADADRRRRLEISFCRIENFQDCDIIESAERDECNNVPAALNDRIRSISFHGADQCTFYTYVGKSSPPNANGNRHADKKSDAGCTGRSFTDSGSVPELHKRFKDRISSYQCS